VGDRHTKIRLVVRQKRAATLKTESLRMEAPKNLWKREVWGMVIYEIGEEIYEKQDGSCPNSTRKHGK